MKGRVVWWIDLYLFYNNKVKTTTNAEFLCTFCVDYSYSLLGCQCSRMWNDCHANTWNQWFDLTWDIWHGMTLSIPDLSPSKLNWLTIGVIPVKRRKIYCLSSLGWKWLLKWHEGRPLWTKIGKKLFVTFPNQQDLQAVSDEVIECDSIPPQFAPLVGNTLEELVFDPHCAVWMKFVRVLMKV